MQPSDIKKALGPNEFKLTLGKLTAFTKSVNGTTKRYVKGKASGVGMDRDTERMVPNTILAFKTAIQDGIFLDDGQWSLVPFRSGHREDWPGDILGHLVDAEVDENLDLYIIAELDNDNSDADFLWAKLTKPPEKGKPVQLGLSIGGRIISAGQEWDDVLQTFVRVFYEIALTEVSVVSNPSYPTTYLMALTKSVDWSTVRGRTVFDVEEHMTKDITLNPDAEAVEKSTDELEVAANVASEEVAEVAKAESVSEEAEVEKTQTAEDAETALEVTKTEDAEIAGEEPAEEVAKATDPTLELSNQLASVMQTIADLTKAVSELTTKSVAAQESIPAESEAIESTEKKVDETDPSNEVVTKAEEKVEETPVVAKTAPDISVDDIASVIKSAIMEALAPLQSRMEELENEPIDKSFAVDTAKTGGGDVNTLVKAYEKDADLLDGRDALRLALERAYA